MVRERHMATSQERLNAAERACSYMLGLEDWEAVAGFHAATIERCRHLSFSSRSKLDFDGIPMDEDEVGRYQADFTLRGARRVVRDFTEGGKIPEGASGDGLSSETKLLLQRLSR